MRHWSLSFLLSVFLPGVTPAVAQMPNPPGQVGAGDQPVHEAYLFAHMMHGDYGRLYYSVSLDGLHWEPLNNGRRVFEEYRGHADICRGQDGRFYLVGNRNDGAPDINFWVSQDLVRWEKLSDLVPDLQHVPDYPKALPRIGAPKVYYDPTTAQYLVTYWDKYLVPAKARHGCMLPITRQQYDTLVKAFGKGGPD